MPLLATKLYIPPLRPHVIRRLRLIERLNAGLHRKLTLISAPAGFGKTTLVNEWVESIERPTAWLSLDSGEKAPTRFLIYLVAALQTIEPTLGKGMLGVLQSSQSPPTEALLTSLLNDITSLLDQFVLVLDLLSRAGGQTDDQALTFLLEHLPPQMPLARFRAGGQLTELRAADLRFTPAEAADFLNQVMDFALSAEDIAALERRTEGWIADLQLAAISLQGYQDTTSFITSFTSSHQFVMDYLV